jgi:LDH2 family malate/lactate/ureidoglycolate dehydrogenase
VNIPPEESARVPSDELRHLAAACLKAAGLRADHADQLAQLLANGDLRGVRTHGTRQIQGYCPALRDGHLNGNPQLAVVQETDASVLVDGDGGLGYAPMMMATEAAIPKAKARGVAVGASRHHGHYGSAGHYVRRAMEDGCTAFSVQGSSSAFGPPDPDPTKRPQSAYWGNPPICFGLPGSDGPPLVLDAATCIMSDEQRSDDYDRLQDVIPAAFFKSMGYTGIARALGGTFVGMDGPAAASVKQNWPRASAGGLIIVMDLGLFADPDEVGGGIDRLVRGVLETMQPVRGYQEATLPGTIEQRLEQDYRRNGVPVGERELTMLRETAQEFGVDLPPALR